MSSLSIEIFRLARFIVSILLGPPKVIMGFGIAYVVIILWYSYSK